MKSEILTELPSHGMKTKYCDVCKIFICLSENGWEKHLIAKHGVGDQKKEGVCSEADGPESHEVMIMPEEEFNKPEAELVDLEEEDEYDANTVDASVCSSDGSEQYAKHESPQYQNAGAGIHLREPPKLKQHPIVASRRIYTRSEHVHAVDKSTTQSYTLKDVQGKHKYSLKIEHGVGDQKDDNVDTEADRPESLKVMILPEDEGKKPKLEIVDLEDDDETVDADSGDDCASSSDGSEQYAKLESPQYQNEGAGIHLRELPKPKQHPSKLIPKTSKHIYNVYKNTRQPSTMKDARGKHKCFIKTVHSVGDQKDDIVDSETDGPENIEVMIVPKEKCKLNPKARKHMNAVDYNTRKPSQFNEALGEHKCSLCHSNFNNFADLVVHTQKWHFTKFISRVCKSCKKRFSINATYERHKCKATFFEDARRKFSEKDCWKVCHQCHRLFVTLKEAQEHITDQGPECTHGVTKDGIERFFLRADFNESVNIDADNSNKKSQSKPVDETYCCTQCSVVFKLKNEWMSHMNWHKNKCPECDKNFVSEPNLVAHVRRHFGVKPFQCDECDRCFGVKGELTVHKKIHSEEFKCPHCKKCFTSQYNVDIHMRRHLGYRPFQCGECCKTFVCKSDLNLHKKNHKPSQTYKCSQCDKKFGCQDTFESHVRICFVVKSFHCDQCDRKFVRKGELTAHKKIHTGEFKCPQCARPFAAQLSLDIHVRRHLGEKPFQCEECGKTFVTKTELRLHNERNHKSSQTQINYIKV